MPIPELRTTIAIEIVQVAESTKSIVVEVQGVPGVIAINLRSIQATMIDLQTTTEIVEVVRDTMTETGMQIVLNHSMT